MYSASTDRPQPPPNAGNIVRFGVIGFIALLIVLVVGKPAVALYMNIGEFDDQFTRPLFYSLVSAVILGIIALVRINIVSRSSIFWYAISTLITFAVALSMNIKEFDDQLLLKRSMQNFLTYGIISGFSFANAASQSHTRMTSSTSDFQQRIQVCQIHVVCV